MGKSLPFISGQEGRIYGSQWLEHLGLKHQTLNSHLIILMYDKAKSIGEQLDLPS